MPGGAGLSESERKSPATLAALPPHCPAPREGCTRLRGDSESARSRPLLTRGRRREPRTLHPGAPLLLLGAFRLDEDVFGQLDQPPDGEVAAEGQRGGRRLRRQGAQAGAEAGAGGRPGARRGPGALGTLPAPRLPVIGHERLHAERQKGWGDLGLVALLLPAHRRRDGEAAAAGLAEGGCGQLVAANPGGRGGHIHGRGHAESARRRHRSAGRERTPRLMGPGVALGGGWGVGGRGRDQPSARAPSRGARHRLIKRRGGRHRPTSARRAGRRHPIGCGGSESGRGAGAGPAVGALRGPPSPAPRPPQPRSVAQRAAQAGHMAGVGTGLADGGSKVGVKLY